MTREAREEIVRGLNELVFRLANGGDVCQPPSWLPPHEWAYVRGIASAEVMRLRDRIEEAVRVTT